MSPFTLHTTVERPVEAVFAFLADSENAPRWYEAVVHAEKLTEGPVRRGTVYRMVRRLPQGRVENRVEVSELEPDRRVTLRSLDGPTPFTYRTTLEPHAGGTRVALEGTVSGQGLEGAAALLAPLASRFFERGMAENLRVLKRVLEAERGSAASRPPLQPAA
ncbi:MAG: SRPBCC family protein [Deinococcales bacterium]